MSVTRRRVFLDPQSPSPFAWTSYPLSPRELSREGPCLTPRPQPEAGRAALGFLSRGELLWHHEALGANVLQTIGTRESLARFRV